MDRNIDDFLSDPELQERLSSLSEEEFYKSLEQDLTEAINQIVTPYASFEPQKELKPLSRNTATRDYIYSGDASTVVKRQDKINLSKNKDLNVLKSTVRSAFEAIIAASNKTQIGDQITSILKQTEVRINQKIDQKLKAQEKNA